MQHWATTPAHEKSQNLAFCEVVVRGRKEEIGYLDEEVAEATVGVEHLHVRVLPLEVELRLLRSPRHVLVALLGTDRRYLLEIFNLY